MFADHSKNRQDICCSTRRHSECSKSIWTDTDQRHRSTNRNGHLKGPDFVNCRFVREMVFSNQLHVARLRCVNGKNQNEKSPARRILVNCNNCHRNPIEFQAFIVATDSRLCLRRSHRCSRLTARNGSHPSSGFATNSAIIGTGGEHTQTWSGTLSCTKPNKIILKIKTFRTKAPPR